MEVQWRVGTRGREVECSPRKRGGVEIGRRTVRRPSTTLNELPGRLQSSSRHWEGYRRNKIQPLSSRCLQSSWKDETHTLNSLKATPRQLVSKAKYRVYLQCTALGNSLQSLEGHDPLGTGQEVGEGVPEKDWKRKQVLVAPMVWL